MKSLFLVAITLLSGCALLTPSNNRQYTYSETVNPDGSKICTLSIDSNSVLAGVTLSACGGSLTASAANVQAGAAAAAVDLPALAAAIGSITQSATLGKTIAPPAPKPAGQP